MAKHILGCLDIGVSFVIDFVITLIKLKNKKWALMFRNCKHKIFNILWTLFWINKYLISNTCVTHFTRVSRFTANVTSSCCYVTIFIIQAMFIAIIQACWAIFTRWTFCAINKSISYYIFFAFLYQSDNQNYFLYT